MINFHSFLLFREAYDLVLFFFKALLFFMNFFFWRSVIILRDKSVRTYCSFRLINRKVFQDGCMRICTKKTYLCDRADRTNAYIFYVFCKFSYAYANTTADMPLYIQMGMRMRMRMHMRTLLLICHFTYKWE